MCVLEWEFWSTNKCFKLRWNMQVWFLCSAFSFICRYKFIYWGFEHLANNVCNLFIKCRMMPQFPGEKGKNTFLSWATQANPFTRGYSLFLLYGFSSFIFWMETNKSLIFLPRYGDEHRLAGFSATLQAIISFVQNGYIVEEI